MTRVAFQGELGAFSQVAAAQLAGKRFTPVPLPWQTENATRP